MTGQLDLYYTDSLNQQSSTVFCSSSRGTLTKVCILHFATWVWCEELVLVSRVDSRTAPKHLHASTEPAASLLLACLEPPQQIQKSPYPPGLSVPVMWVPPHICWIPHAAVWGISSAQTRVMTFKVWAQSASEGLVADLLHEHCEGKRSLRSLAWLSSSMHAGTAWRSSSAQAGQADGLLCWQSAATLRVHWLTGWTEGRWGTVVLWWAPTDDNYDTGWKVSCTRYDSSRHSQWD